MRLDDAGLETEWFRNLTARVSCRAIDRRKGVHMFMRLRVWLGRLLIGSNFKVMRDGSLVAIFEAATRLRSYIDRSGALHEKARVNAYYVVQREAEAILKALEGADVRL